MSCNWLLFLLRYYKGSAEVVDSYSSSLYIPGGEWLKTCTNDSLGLLTSTVWAMRTLIASKSRTSKSRTLFGSVKFGYWSLMCFKLSVCVLKVPLLGRKKKTYSFRIDDLDTSPLLITAPIAYWASDVTPRGSRIMPDTSFTGCCQMYLWPCIHFTRESRSLNTSMMYTTLCIRCMQTIESAIPWPWTQL